MTIPPKKTSSQPKSCHSEGLKKPEESPGKVVLPCENIRPSTVISSVVERSPNEWYEQGQTKKPYTFFTTMPFRAIHGAKREFMAKPIHDALHQFIQSEAVLPLSRKYNSTSKRKNCVKEGAFTQFLGWGKK